MPAGIAASPGGELPNAPLWTDAFGAVYATGPWEGTLTYKQSGSFISTQGPKFGGFDTVDASVAYDFGRVKVKLQGFNLADRRSTTALAGPFFVFQTGRDVEVTLIGKF